MYRDFFGKFLLKILVRLRKCGYTKIFAINQEDWCENWATGVKNERASLCGSNRG